jgi:hypothetical protein
MFGLETMSMATLSLVLSAIAAVASIATLVGVIAVRRVELKRRSHTSQKMYWDSHLGIFTSNPEDLQRYRDSIKADSDRSLP